MAQNHHDSEFFLQVMPLRPPTRTLSPLSLAPAFPTDPPRPATPWQGDRSWGDLTQTMPRPPDRLGTL